jgi:hypothetical protein
MKAPNKNKVKYVDLTDLDRFSEEQFIKLKF